MRDPNTVIIGHLNINFFRNKYETFAEFIENVNIFLISESKLDDTFPDKQFHINDFKIFICDRNRYGGGLILYVHEGISCKPLKIPLFDLNIEIIGLEFHQVKRKWLFVGTYKPPVVNDLEFTNEFIKILNHFSSKYENLITIVDLNISIENFHLNTLLQLFNLNTLTNSPTCYQSHIPTCIDHILTNQKPLFKFSKTFETGLSDHHKLISKTMKSGSFKGSPKRRFTDVIKTLTLQILATL